MQLSPLDASLRDPASRVGDGANVITAGLRNPDQPQLMTQDEIQRLRLRKRLEYELILSLDKTKLDVRKECWYLIDANWLNQWAQFVDIEKQDRLQKERVEKEKQKEERRKLRQQRWEEADISDDEYSDEDSSDEEGDEDEIELFYDPEQDDVEEPGVLSTAELLDEKGKPLSGLTAKIDYRGVPSSSYFCFKELYGSDKSPDLPRYVVDIYKPSVGLDRLVPIQMKAKQEAKARVGALRPKWMQWELEYDKDEEDEDDNTIMSCCCFGLTKDHVEAFIYWGVRCCFWFTSRRKDARNNISYRQYNPLRYREGDSTRGLDSSHGGSTRSSTSSRSSRSSVRSSSGRSSRSNRSSSRRSQGSSRSRGSRRRRRDDGIDYADRDYRLTGGQYLRDFLQFRFLRA